LGAGRARDVSAETPLNFEPALTGFSLLYCTHTFSLCYPF
jgi:hypothetical protein